MVRAEKVGGVGWRSDRPGECHGLHGVPPPEVTRAGLTPGTCELSLIRKRVFAHGQLEMGSLRQALVHCDCVLISRGQDSDTHGGTTMQDTGRNRPPTPGSRVSKCPRFKLPGPRRFFTAAQDTDTGTLVIRDDQWL